MKSLLQHWVTDQAMQRPDSIAVSRENLCLRFKELEIQSNQLARILKKFGCCKGDRICLLMPKVPEAITSIIGILKADCIYVPLDNESPANRLVKIVEQCNPKVILASGKNAELLTGILKRINFDDDPIVGWMDSKGFDEQEPPEKLKPEFSFKDLGDVSSAPVSYKNVSDDPAHILFTSGSTGEPKGVITSHENDLEFIRWAKNYFGILSDDHLSNHSPLHFDMSSLDIYGALSSGAHLHMVPKDYNVVPHKIADFIKNTNITQWFSVPSILNYMAQFDVVEKGDFPSLKRIIWCGEECSTPVLRYWMKRLPNASFTNLYGPTETTVASSYYTVPEIPKSDNTKIPIGNACAGEDFYVLDNQLNPVPSGEVGNLYISGAGVSLGYWNDKERTDESFLFNPYAIDGDRIFYKTGDLVHQDEDGFYYFHGRKDNQIKSRGYRIELGEIENAIKSLQLTIECAVVAIPAEGFERNKICCAFVPSGVRNDHISGAYLELKLSNLLPDYMIPHHWESFVILPKNKNGKINRNELKYRFLNRETEANAK